MTSTCRLKLYGIAFASAIVVAACGGGGGYSGGMASVIAPPAAAPAGGGAAVMAKGFVATNLVSDLPVANTLYANANADPTLVDAWGVVFNPRAFVWVANRSSSTSTLYDGAGVPQSLVVSIPPGTAGSARPTGIVFNGHSDFMVTANGMTGASAFIFAGQGGTLSGWSPGVDQTHAITVFDGGNAGAVYTGLALASRGASDFLYAADFRNATVDMFDAAFNKVGGAGSFVDQALPPGYAPYGIQAIGDRVYVSYARQGAQTGVAVPGAGQGAIDVFDTAGNLVKRLVSPGGALNAPWGMAMAPAAFGTFGNALLVANVGDGKINAFDTSTGVLLGTMSMADGNPIAIDGLHGIAFGNGIGNQPTDTLFFAAGPGGGSHGVYGRIDIR